MEIEDALRAAAVRERGARPDRRRFGDPVRRGDGQLGAEQPASADLCVEPGEWPRHGHLLGPDGAHHHGQLQRRRHLRDPPHGQRWPPVLERRRDRDRDLGIQPQSGGQQRFVFHERGRGAHRGGTWRARKRHRLRRRLPHCERREWSISRFARPADERLVHLHPRRQLQRLRLVHLHRERRARRDCHGHGKPRREPGQRPARGGQ